MHFPTNPRKDVSQNAFQLLSMVLAQMHDLA